MKKVFIVAGELSGDNIAQWYYKKQLTKGDCKVEAVGGGALQQEGVRLYAHYKSLNLTGIIEVVKKLPFIFSFLNRLVKYIVKEQFNEVVLVDFPGFNLMLARRLKKRNPSIRITYVSPPQLWCWGSWRVKKLRRWCDDVVVMYPFEVAWYKKRHVHARWLGSPVFERVKQYFPASQLKEEKKVALLPASRNHELEMLFPICVDFVRKLSKKVQGVSFILPLASSISRKSVEKLLEGMETSLEQLNIRLVEGEGEREYELATSCLAFTKPGTVTLELALFGIPTIMFFKTSAINYFLGKKLVKVNHMALPNLLLDKPIYKEFIQEECSINAMVKEAEVLLKSFEEKGDVYARASKNLSQLRELLQS